jgi:hypothetical protein
MATRKLSRRHKAMTLVPLALLCGAWTASLSGLGSATAAGDRTGDGSLPDGTKVPSQAIQAPANVPVAGVIAPGVPAGTADQVVDNASTSGIPSAALSAYQRAAQIIDAADKTCNIPWELIAAIGRVESDHGRYDGNVLDAQGVSEPGIYGVELDGHNGTQAIQDTDGGEIDKDPAFDRAVGPMQFIPSTWQVVKVDADGDGKRNPQDIDDASLATAVYLCSGSEDLGARPGQESAVYRYNHSKAYVDLVLRIMQAYMSGDYTAVPDSASGGNLLGLSDSTAMNQVRGHATTKKHKAHLAQVQQHAAGTSPSGVPTTSPTSGSGSNGSAPKSPTVPKVPASTPKPPPVVASPVPVVVKTLNQLGETTSFCAGQLGTYQNLPGAMSACTNKVGGLTKDAASNLLGPLDPKQLLNLLGIKLPLGL